MDAIKDNPDKTYPHVCRYWADEIEGVPRRFNAKKYPLVVMHQVSTVRVWNHDPKVAYDIFKTHNKLTDKISETEDFFKPLLGESIIGMKNNDDWRAKRKACAHGFYKERMKHMIETLKNEINLRVTQWKTEIAENGGSTRIDIAKDFADIFAQNLIMICFGEDMKNRLVEIEFMTDRDKMTFEPRKVNIVVALNNIFEQLNLLIANRAKNPLEFLMLTLFSIELNTHWSYKIVIENCRRVRQYC